MRARVYEETIMFISITKWFFLAAIVGSMVGVATTYFIKLLTWSTKLSDVSLYYFFLLPLALPLSYFIIKKLAPDAEGHGTEKVIEAVHKHSAIIKPMVVPVKLVATVITVAAGGSVGKEGPAAQIGAGLASIFSRIMNFSAKDRKKLVICGISAGFASVFGTPIAGSLFGVEVLFVGSLMYDVLLPSFIAGITSYHVSTALGLTYFHSPLKFTPVFSPAFFLKVAVAGIFFGVCSFILIETLNFFDRKSKESRLNPMLKAFLAGLLLVLLSFFVKGNYFGLGLDTIESALQGNMDIVWYAFFIKILYTSITLNYGGSGGIVTPIFFIGSTAGILFTKLFGGHPGTFAAIGFVSLLGGAANTPIAASIMSVELFGPELAPYAIVACIISFLMTGNRSVYPTQVITVRKSESIHVDLGEEIEDIESKLHVRHDSASGIILKLFHFLRKRFKPSRKKRNGNPGKK